MKTAFIIHGAHGNSGENWFPWLKEELEAQGWQVIAPDFPTPEKQSLESWKKEFKKYGKHIGKDSIFIGHSLGAAFALSVIEGAKQPVKAAYFVAGFVSPLGNEFDALNRTFLEKKFNWEKIRRNCGKFTIFASDNDPYVPLEKGEGLAQKLGAEAILVQGAGHFNEKAGYKKFQLLLENILII